VFLTIRGERYYLWRAVDQDGHVLDILVQRRRDKKAAKKFFRKLLKGCQYVPHVLVTDRLKSYGAAQHEVLPSVEHRQHRYLNNRAENSHQPPRQRERRLQGFKHRVTPSAFSRRMVLSPNTSARDVTFSPPSNTLKRWGKDSTPGRTSRAFSPLHSGDDPGSRAPSCSLILSTGNKLTTPSAVLPVVQAQGFRALSNGRLTPPPIAAPSIRSLASAIPTLAAFS
jgi:hypothetical protein